MPEELAQYKTQGPHFDVCMFSADRSNRFYISLGVAFTSEHKNKPRRESDEELGH